MNFHIDILLQRVMELLALYLILANMTGKDLKEAFEWLWTDKQRIFYENFVIFVGYVVVMTIIIGESWELGYLIAHVLSPFIGLLLVKRFDPREGIMAFVFLIFLAAIVTLPNLINLLPHLINFGTILMIVIWFVHRHFPYKAYRYLTSRKIWMNATFIVAFLIYFVPIFPSEEYLMVAASLVFLFLLKMRTKKGTEKELARIVDTINNCSYDELLSFLEEISHEHVHSERIYHFVIEDKKPLSEFIDTVSAKLESFKAEGQIRDGECRLIDEQIKITVLL